MKRFKQDLADARKAILNCLKSVDEVAEEKQNVITSYLNAAISNLDNVKENFEKAWKISTQAELISSMEKGAVGAIPKGFDDYKLMLLRIEPDTYKGQKVTGYLETFHLPVTIPEIIEKTTVKYGGGKYQLRIIDDHGKYIKSKTFDVVGNPKVAEHFDD